MSQCGDHMASLIHLDRIDVRNHETRILSSIGKHLAPRIDDQRVAESLALPGWVPHWAGAMT